MSFSFTSWVKNLKTNSRGLRRNKRCAAVRTIRSTRLKLEQWQRAGDAGRNLWGQSG